MSTPVSMSPLLLASASFGSWRTMSFLLNRKDGPADVVPTKEFLDLLDGGTGTATNAGGLSNSNQEASDVEGGTGQTSWPVTTPLLEGVTTDGDTVLHVLATCGDGDNFLRCAGLVHYKASHLIVAQNKRGETPLHCATRSGRSKMVSTLIALLSGEADGSGGDMVKEVLRKENVRKETALHEAVRLGSRHMVELLMAADSDLANFPRDGASPLYLAILLEYIDIAHSQYLTSGGNLSYSGSNGQTALHAAVIRSQEMTNMLLKWNIGLTAQRDQNGSTPLHFATSLLRPIVAHHWIQVPWFPWERRFWHSAMSFKQVLHANIAPVYQSDDKGLFPVHVAADKGATEAVIMFLEICPNIAGLRDTKGRTFLHVAVEKEHWHTVSHACKTPSLSWIWNMEDNDGNTALHLAVKHDVQYIFCLHLENLEVQLNITNNNGETPLDLFLSKMRAGYFYEWNPRYLINGALRYCHAKHGNRRLDHFEEKYIQPYDESKESEKMTLSSQTLGLGSVLMATVAFGASFTLPGGYNGDGTPALSGRYVFDAFVVANSLAFGCAGLATVHLMFSGASLVDIPLRMLNFDIATLLAYSAVMSLGTAYALGLYVTLAPVAYGVAVAICVFAAMISLWGFMDILRCLPVAIAILIRLRIQALVTFARLGILRGTMLFWPLVQSFIGAAISAKLRHK